MFEIKQLFCLIDTRVFSFWRRWKKYHLSIFLLYLLVFVDVYAHRHALMQSNAFRKNQVHLKDSCQSFASCFGRTCHKFRTLLVFMHLNDCKRRAYAPQWEQTKKNKACAVRGAVWLSFQSSPSRTLRWNSQGGTFSPCVLFVPTSSMYMFMGLAVICMHLLGNKIKRFIFCIFYTTVLRSERCKKLLYWAQLSFFPSSCMAYFFLAECVWRPFWKPNKFYN